MDSNYIHLIDTDANLMLYVLADIRAVNIFVKY
jgi:hypothetical protein